MAKNCAIRQLKLRTTSLKKHINGVHSPDEATPRTAKGILAVLGGASDMST